jgi:hypothetical protein
MSMQSRQALCLLVVGLLAGSVCANWPHLRGSRYDGVCAETGLAAAWSTGGPPRLWSRELGQGYSGFILADGKLYTHRQTLGGQYLLCLDPDTGHILWEHRYDWAWQPRGAYPGPYASPTAHGGKIFYASTSGLVGCVDAHAGTPLWSRNVREAFQGKGWDFGYAATPLVEDDKVILPVGGPGASLVALHVNDGRTVWTAGSDPASYCPAFPLTVQGRRCVLGYLQNSILFVELSTGKLLHRQPLSAGYDEHSAWPIYREPHLLLASPFKVPATRYEIQVFSDQELRLKPQWLSKELCNDVVSSVLYEGHLYGFDLQQLQTSPRRASRGLFRCLDWATGKTCWSTDEVGQSSVVVADGKLLLFNDTGTLILARADPSGYHELARTQLFSDEICWTPPLFWRGKLYVRSPTHMVCLYLGVPDPQQPPISQAAVPPARAWRIDPGWLLTYERDFPNDAPSAEEMVLWFGAALFAFGGAGFFTLLFARCVHRSFAFPPVYWSLVFLLGALGPSVFSALAEECLFTWPASLYAAFHCALWLAWRTRQSRWQPRLAIAGFLLIAWVYFEACQTVGMFIGWSFLVGFPFAFPFTYLAVQAPQRWKKAAWTLLAFTALFASAQVLLLWQTHVRG